jgi:tetrahydromethanopterin S-methyltransferase subunit G
VSDVSRDEFDDLAARVERLERQHGALLSLTTEELAGLRVDLRDGLGMIDGRLDGMDGRLGMIDGRLDGMDGRLDGIESKLDSYTEQVNQALRAGTDAGKRHERMMRRLGDHFGVDFGPEDD